MSKAAEDSDHRATRLAKWTSLLREAHAKALERRTPSSERRRREGGDLREEGSGEALLVDGDRAAASGRTRTNSQKSGGRKTAGEMARQLAHALAIRGHQSGAHLDSSPPGKLERNRPNGAGQVHEVGDSGLHSLVPPSPQQPSSSLLTAAASTTASTEPLGKGRRKKLRRRKLRAEVEEKRRLALRELALQKEADALEEKIRDRRNAQAAAQQRAQRIVIQRKFAAVEKRLAEEIAREKAKEESKKRAIQEAIRRTQQLLRQRAAKTTRTGAIGPTGKLTGTIGRDSRGDGTGDGGRWRNSTMKAPAQLCVYFQRFGKCAHANCKYVHDSSKVSICTKFLLNECADADCPLAHVRDETRIPVCTKYLTGTCANDRCPFLHVNAGVGSGVCEMFSRQGFCTLGAKCSKLHMWRCPKQLRTGECGDEEKCPYHHIVTPARRHHPHEETECRGSEAKEVQAQAQVEEEEDCVIVLDSDEDETAAHQCQPSDISPREQMTTLYRSSLAGDGDGTTGPVARSAAAMEDVDHPQSPPPSIQVRKRRRYYEI